MSKLPRVVIDLPKIVHNYQTIEARCRKVGIALSGVVKGVAGDLRVIGALIEAGLSELGDSRLENLKQIARFSQVRKMLLRVPSPSRIVETLQYSDISLNSESEVLVQLNCSATKHQVVLMVDLGDLREGVMENELGKLGRLCRGLPNLHVIGLGANFSCFTGVKPTVAKLEHLAKLADFLTAEYQLPLNFVSGGNSSSLSLLYSGTIPDRINHLRIGEGILLGRETLDGNLLPDLYHDAFIVEAEVVQVQWKPATPEGEIGYDAFGRNPEIPFVEAGNRILLSIGHQDTPLNGLKPIDPDFTLLGGSSDYAVLASRKKCQVGQVLQLTPNYWSMLGLMTSPYVTKKYLV